MLYAVHLKPLVSKNLSALEELSSNGTKHYALISETSVVEKAETPTKLGVKYQRSSQTQINSSESNIESISYNCPIELINTGKEIYRVRQLGRLHVLEFERGLLISLQNTAQEGE